MLPAKSNVNTIIFIHSLSQATAIPPSERSGLQTDTEYMYVKDDTDL